MPLIKTASWPFGFQQQGLAQPLPPSEPDPWMYPGPTIPGFPYPPANWPRFTWPIVPMPGQAPTFPSPSPQAQGVSRAVSALMAFLSGAGGDHESAEATPTARSGGCNGQCSKYKKR